MGYKRMHAPKPKKIKGVLKNFEYGRPPVSFRNGKPPCPGRYWVRLGSVIGVIEITAADIVTWPRSATWAEA